MRRFVKILVFLLLVASCKSQAPKQKSGDNESDAKPAHLEFKTTTLDFGTITAGEVISLAFTFTNTGGKPLKIYRTGASCACTVSDFPKVPVAPGKSATINVIFDSGGFSGQVYKKVTIFSNADNSPTDLIIKGVVTINN